MGRRRQERQTIRTWTRSKGECDDDIDGVRMGRMALWDVPFELVGEVASAGAVAEAGDVESSTASARHVGAGIKTGMCV